MPASPIEIHKPVINSTHWLEQPTDIAPLAYARIILGMLMGLELSGGMFTNYIQTLLQGKFHFSYMPGLHIDPWPIEALMYLHFVVNFVLGLMVAAGWYYRFAVWAFFLSASTLFLMEKSLYINHIYLYCLVLFLMGFLPAHRGASLDVRRKPALAVSEVPAWTVYAVLALVVIVYFYAGLAKINTDWLQAQPIKLWLSRKGSHPLAFLISQEWYAYLVAYGGILFDLLVVPFMWWAKSRKIAFALVIFFHADNALTFGIGTFPWFSIAVTALFFPPHVFRRWSFLGKKLLPAGTRSYQFGRWQRKGVLWLMGLFFGIQLLLPLRPYLYPGSASWTEEGHFFAWRMMLRSKQSTIQFSVEDPTTNRTERVMLADHLNPRQLSKMGGNPDMILQFAHYLAQYYKTEHAFKAVEVRAHSRVALNGRPFHDMVLPDTDLAKERRGWRPYTWVCPLPGN